MKKLIYLIQFIIVIIIVIPFSFLPEKIIPVSGNILGRILFLLWPGRRRIAIENIRKAIQNNCLPATISPSDIAANSFRHLGISFIELSKVYLGRGTRIIESISVEGIENFHKASSYNKGILGLTGHYGNWELLALIFSSKISKITGVARKQNNPYINKLVEKTRTKFGSNVIYKKGALKAILLKLKDNDTIGVLYDQSVLEKEGILVDFLCRKAWTMKMPVIISRKTGAPILPFFIRRTARGHVITIYPPFLPDSSVELETHLRHLNKYIEKHIKECPEQWLWIHRRWKRTA
ncbi:lipid A biosynthesis lauroyl acyltransferase [bacterium BMS3Abin07]|nr:lipid A biosynthesis lauroyl acyltransferase [bacterium BMS3Abin07]GBE32300.1 lipid A biosynthesis lauroyl acyltransferase [bacterium BMS3Bbin05]HDO23090.1 lipid A biosynthesis acyltransferase [Nitrospirota bacterium]HDZ88209.1 lipid A biosynthesis acyltransferase [Nitrospirota bacterium]